VAVGRALFAVGTLLVLLIGGLSVVVVLARDDEKLAVDNLLSENLTRAIALAEDEVRLPALAPFAWDEVLIVARDVPDAAISERLGYEWNGELHFRTGELLLFVDDGRVVRFADYRGEGRFEGFETPIASLPRERAVLEVRNLVISPG
jgi:hypothetical protein